MRRLLPALLCCALVTCLTALAHAHTGHGVGERPRLANVDGGPELERVVTRSLCQGTDGALTEPVATMCPAGALPRHRVELGDTCDGRPRALALSPVQDFVVRLRVTDVDGDPAFKEVFLDARSGATARGGLSRIVRMRADGDGNCARAETLFRYPSKATAAKAPPGALARTTWDAEVRDYARRYRGKEVRLLELFVDRDDPYCCPTFLRTTFFRLAREAGTYVPFRRAVERIKD
jgi:hypothetical protein